MATKIEWCDETINAIKMRCTPVSEGCQNCYAERLLGRNLPGMDGYPPAGGAPIMDYRDLEKPLHWKKPRRIFVESMGDLFHEDVEWNDQFKLFQFMTALPQHTFMILTKRPQVMAKRIKDIHFHLRRNIPVLQLPIPNIWLGVTIENNNHRDRWDELSQIPAAVRFVSVEPMLGRVDFGPRIDEIDWVICGAETGPKAREMKTEWALDLLAQCDEAQVPFFFKKWSKGYMELTEMPREYPRGTDG